MMRSRLRTIVAATILLYSAACFGGSVPATELYRLSLPAPAEAPGNGTHELLPGSVAIARYATPGVYGGRGIVYRVEDTEYGVYPTREWAIPLGEMLAMLTEDVMRREPLATEGAVYNPPSRRAFTYLWRGSVSQFEEVVRGKEIFAGVQLEVRLVRIADDSVLWSGERRLERPVAKATMPSIVEALSLLGNEVVASLVQEARSAVPRLTPDSTAGRP